MKRLISVLLVLGLAFCLIGSVSAVEGNEDNCEIQTFSYESDGNAYLVETRRYDHYAVAKLYKNGVLIQESVADSVTDKLDTNIYGIDGSVQYTQACSLSAMNTDESEAVMNPTENQVNTLLVEPRYRVPSIYDEPVDNTDMYVSMSHNGLIYYFLGSASDSFAPHVIVGLHRAYTSTYLGETSSYTWGANATVSAVSAYYSLISGSLPGAVLGVLVLIGGEVLAYAQAVKLATYTHDYTYKGVVDGGIYYTANRNITYWRIDNETTGNTTWSQKRFNYGYGGSNQDMIRATAEAYCAAN